MEVRAFALGPLQTNCFVLSEGKECIVVDPGGDPTPLLEFTEAEGLQVTHILNTHLHCDHIYGNKALADAAKAPVLISKDDESLLQTEIGGGGFMGLPKVDVFPYEYIAEGETTFLGKQCRVLSTPGHSPGSLSFYFPEAGVVFVGDLLFNRSIGRTDFSGGDFNVLKDSVIEKIFSLPDETQVFPGHGPQTNVKEEKLNNPFFSDFGF